MKKFNQLLNNILINPYFSSKNIQLTMNKSNDVNSYWIAGFIDLIGTFQINFKNKEDGSISDIIFNLQISQKETPLLNIIKKEFSGVITYNKSQDIYYYMSNSLDNAYKILRYLDKYHLQSTNYLNYLKWRKAYIIIQDKLHYTEIGMNKIKKLKDSMIM